MITAKELIELADNMAAAASQMGSMGYEALIHSRDQLITNVYKLYENINLNDRVE
jgi:hypothetical protein